MGESNENPMAHPIARFHGEFGPLFKIFIFNLLLTIVTIGFYRFWAKTRVRHYLWTHTGIEGDRLEYSGTGKELLLGFLIIAGVILLPFFILPQVLLAIFAPDDVSLSSTVTGMQAVLVFLLTPAAIFRARRYRLTRTQWRAIRGAQTGSAWVYTMKSIGFTLLNLVTLGFAYPFSRTRLAHYRLSNTWFGDKKLEFSAGAKSLYGAFIVMLLLSVLILVLDIMVVIWISKTFFPMADLQKTLETNQGMDPGKMALFAILNLLVFFITLPIPFLWYLRAEIRHFARSTKYLDLEFSFDAKYWPFVWLMVSNNLLRLITLGFAQPYVFLRLARFVAYNLKVAGSGDFATIVQSVEPMPGTGEGMADAFDVDAF